MYGIQKFQMSLKKYFYYFDNNNTVVSFKSRKDNNFE